MCLQGGRAHVDVYLCRILCLRKNAKCAYKPFSRVAACWLSTFRFALELTKSDIVLSHDLRK